MHDPHGAVPNAGGPADLEDKLEEFRGIFARCSLRGPNAEWSYWRGGEPGETVFWLPGALGVGEFAFPQALALAPQFRILLPDYPAVPDLKNLVQGLVALLDRERVDAAHLVGGSFGGMVAQHFARAHPDRVLSLLLSHTTAPDPSFMRAALVRIVSVVLPERPYRALFRWRLRRAVLVGDPFWATYFDEITRRLDKAALVSRVKLASEFLQTELRPTRAVHRVLIAYSDADPLMPASNVAELCRLYPKAERYMFTGTGHSAPLLRPEEYVRVVRQFLTGGAT